MHTTRIDDIQRIIAINCDTLKNWCPVIFWNLSRLLRLLVSQKNPASRLGLLSPPPLHTLACRTPVTLSLEKVLDALLTLPDQNLACGLGTGELDSLTDKGEVGDNPRALTSTTLNTTGCCQDDLWLAAGNALPAFGRGESTKDDTVDGTEMGTGEHCDERRGHHGHCEGLVSYLGRLLKPWGGIREC